MRLLSLLKKTLLENIRDWKMLIMTVTLAPFFVVIMYFYFGHAETTHRIVVVNKDEGVTPPGEDSFNAGRALVSALANAESSEGVSVLDVREVADLETARTYVRDGGADLAVEIPEDFSRVLWEYGRSRGGPAAVVNTYGDPANAGYLMAAVWSDMVSYEYAAGVAGIDTPIEVRAEVSGGFESLTDFELYVPGLLVLSVIMLMFTAAASLIKEEDKGTLLRLRISNMTMSEWLSAVTLVQVLIGVSAVVLTLLTAVALGYETTGSLVGVLVVAVFASLAIMSISVGVAALLRTVFDLLTVGTVPFFLLMFFSGGMFPIPDLRVMSVGERVINANDILPTTHATSALNKILNYDAGLGDVAYDLAAVAALTVIFFGFGAWLFARRHMRPA